MDEKKKQIVLLCILGVLVVGAGSYYFLNRDTGPSRLQAVDTGPVVRKKRDAPEPETNRRRKVQDRRADTSARPEITRRERRERPKVDTGRKVRRAGGTKKVKKKKTPLAG